MAEFLVLAAFATFAVALLAAFIPSIRASAARKRAGKDEVLLSTWRDWGFDDPQVPGGYGEMLNADPEVAPEPEYGVIRIQAR